MLARIVVQDTPASVENSILTFPPAFDCQTISCCSSTTQFSPPLGVETMMYVPGTMVKSASLESVAEDSLLETLTL